MAIRFCSTRNLNPSDYLSQHPLTSLHADASLAHIKDFYVNFIAQCHLPKAMTNEEVVAAMVGDQQLQGVVAALNNPVKRRGSARRGFASIHELFSTDNSELLKRNRLVLPAALQHLNISIGPTGSQGITKSTKLMKQKVCLPT